MKKINDIFYSLQGEGRNTGRAAVFVRFSGCNLRCPFCDTEFDTGRLMTDREILDQMMQAGPLSYPEGGLLAVLTGGEPALQADEPFVSLLQRHGFEVAMESNGTRPVPANLDWLTLSPKGSAPRLGAARHPDELKLVFDGHTDPEALLRGYAEPAALAGTLLYLQPCDTGDERRNRAILDACLSYIRRHPRWRLSLQTHKLAGFK